MNIDFAKPSFSPESRRAILSEIDAMLISGRLMMGKNTHRFESAFSKLVGCEYALSTNTCTTALQICLNHFDVRGCEVLLPAASFITDASVIRWSGGIPVLVDIDPETLSFDLADLKKKLSPRTKGIIWVHLIGFISPTWAEILAFARENDLFIIEDCAHAHGASVDGKVAGSIGDAGCFSFYPTKVITCGTGGMLVTQDPDLARSARELRMFGREDGAGSVIREGNDWFLDELRACVGFHQMNELEEFLNRRRAIALRYEEGLAQEPHLRRLKVPNGNLPAWYHYSVFVSEAIDHAQFMENLQNIHGIPTRVIYPPIHQEVIFRDLDDGTLRQAEKMLNRSLCLPMHTQLSNDDVDVVIAAVRKELLKAK